MNHIATPNSRWASQNLASDEQDIFARRVVARLSEASQDLPYDISERLRAARVQALAKRKAVATAPATAPISASATPTSLVQQGQQAVLGSGGHDFGWLSGLGSLVPLLALVAGLMFIQTFHESRGAHDVAEVDMALLTDDLPPQAYSDPGFLQYLKHETSLEH